MSNNETTPSPLQRPGGLAIPGGTTSKRQRTRLQRHARYVLAGQTLRRAVADVDDALVRLDAIEVPA